MFEGSPDESRAEKLRKKNLVLHSSLPFAFCFRFVFESPNSPPQRVTLAPPALAILTADASLIQRVGGLEP